MKWQKHTFHGLQITKETQKAVLFRIPETDWQFWYPLSLVEPDTNCDLVFTLPPDMKIEVSRYDDIHHTKLEAKTLSVHEFIAFAEQPKQATPVMQHLRSILDSEEEGFLTEATLWNRLLTGGYSQDYIRRSWLRNTGKTLTNQQLASIALERL